MIDLMNVAAYRENNRIEAKKALGGLPKSIWETYSAFANALGGVILLGVQEHKDTSLTPVNLPDPEGMVRQFWELMRDGKTVSVNILTEENVRIAEVDGKHIIAIEVPRARRSLRPVYIGGDPMTGTYRRNGEGDYRCKREEVLEMQRDAVRQTADMRLLTDVGMDALDDAGAAAYLACVGVDSDDPAVLVQLSAAGWRCGERRTPFPLSTPVSFVWMWLLPSAAACLIPAIWRCPVCLPGWVWGRAPAAVSQASMHFGRAGGGRCPPFVRPFLRRRSLCGCRWLRQERLSSRWVNFPIRCRRARFWPISRSISVRRKRKSRRIWTVTERRHPAVWQSCWQRMF